MKWKIHQKKMLDEKRGKSCRKRNTNNINIWGKINRAFLPLRNLCCYIRNIYKTSKNLFFCKIIAKLSIRKTPVYTTAANSHPTYQNIYLRTAAAYTLYPTELLWSYKFFLFIKEFFLGGKTLLCFFILFSHKKKVFRLPFFPSTRCFG